MVNFSRHRAHFCQEFYAQLFSVWCSGYGEGQELIDRMLDRGYSHYIAAGRNRWTGCSTPAMTIESLFNERKEFRGINQDVQEYDDNYLLGEYLFYYMWLHNRTLAEIFSVYTYDELMQYAPRFGCEPPGNLAYHFEEGLVKRGLNPSEPRDI